MTAICQTALRSLPLGTTPPLVITYTASSTPVVQLGLSSKTLPEQQVFDLAQNFLRTQLTTVQGAGTPYPFGGKPRQIQVDLDSAKLQAYGLSPNDIVNAVAAQNLILPAGTTKIGPTEYNVEPVSYTHLDVYKRQGSPLIVVGGSFSTVAFEPGTCRTVSTCSTGFQHDAGPSVAAKGRTFTNLFAGLLTALQVQYTLLTGSYTVTKSYSAPDGDFPASSLRVRPSASRQRRCTSSCTTLVPSARV